MISAGINKSRATGADPARVARQMFSEVRAEFKKGMTKKTAKVDESKARSAVKFNQRFAAGTSRFGTKAPDFSLEGRIASRIGDGVPTDAECHYLALASQKLSPDQFTGVMEKLIERGSRIVSHHKFRGVLDRDGNLTVNQAIRAANDNIAYSSVDFDLEGVSDEEFWARIDASEHNDVIKRNAVVGMLKMADKLGIIDKDKMKA